MNHVPGVLVIADHELHADHAAGRVFHDGEGLRENFIQALLQEGLVMDLREFGLPCGGLLAERLLGQGLQLLLQLVDLGHERQHPAHLALVF